MAGPAPRVQGSKVPGRSRDGPGNRGTVRDDLDRMRCEDCREAASARLDAEAMPAGLTDAEVDHHLEGCAECRAWVAGATSLHRAVRVRPAAPVADRTDAILAAVPITSRPRRVREGVRYALLAIGLSQLLLALPALILAEDAQAPVHVAREMGAFELALGVGLLATAWRPRLAAGLLPFAGALAGAMLLTAGIDVVQGEAVALTEAHHVLDLVGVALLALLHPRERGGVPRRARLAPA
jgi:predicted anti-sigma-YlaC factor YlaD